VVSTLVRCTVRDPARALAEVRRVLKPDGRLLLIEHVRSDEPALARWQDLLERPWSWFGHGCHCNRPTMRTLSAAGFSVGELRQERLPKAPPIVRPLVIGAAARM
jgi:ubiquinone/menaquinone biosynthesis C-methylase UbiE